MNPSGQLKTGGRAAGKGEAGQVAHLLSHYGPPPQRMTAGDFLVALRCGTRGLTGYPLADAVWPAAVHLEAEARRQGVGLLARRGNGRLTGTSAVAALADALLVAIDRGIGLTR